MADSAVRTSTSTMLLDGLLDTGNQASWREFDHRYRPIITGFAQRLGLSADDAADAAQETLLQFFRAYREGKYDRSKGRLRTWIMAIAKYRVLDCHRAHAGRPAQSGQSVLAELPDEHSLSDIWEAERRAGLLRQALDELRENSRTSEKALRAFELYVLKQQPAETVAAELGMTTQDVYMVKNRVAVRLRDILARLDEMFDDG